MKLLLSKMNNSMFVLHKNILYKCECKSTVFPWKWYKFKHLCKQWKICFMTECSLIITVKFLFATLLNFEYTYSTWNKTRYWTLNIFNLKQIHADLRVDLVFNKNDRRSFEIEMKSKMFLGLCCFRYNL